MQILEDLLLRNKIVNLTMKLDSQDELDIWANYALDKVYGEFLKSSEKIHYGDEITVDITIAYEFKYSEYRRIIRNLRKIDRILRYDPETRLTHIVTKVDGLQKREAT